MSGVIRQGSCLCGAVRIELHGEPLVTYACYCTDCQKQAGGPASHGALVPNEAVKVVSGEDLLTTYIITGTSSGAEKTKKFCSKCGSDLFHIPGGKEGKVTSVRTGILDGGVDTIQPMAELYVKDRSEYCVQIPGAQQFQTQEPPFPFIGGLAAFAPGSA